MMLLENYRQAINIISVEGLAVQEAMNSLGFQARDIDQWQAEEEEYFTSLGKEPEWDVFAVAYVELLQRFWKLEYVSFLCI